MGFGSTTSRKKEWTMAPLLPQRGDGQWLHYFPKEGVGYGSMASPKRGMSYGSTASPMLGMGNVFMASPKTGMAMAPLLPLGWGWAKAPRLGKARRLMYFWAEASPHKRWRSELLPVLPACLPAGDWRWCYVVAARSRCERASGGSKRR